jgi:hypothetical protein
MIIVSHLYCMHVLCTCACTLFVFTRRIAEKTTNKLVTYRRQVVSSFLNQSRMYLISSDCKINDFGLGVVTRRGMTFILLDL